MKGFQTFALQPQSWFVMDMGHYNIAGAFVMFRGYIVDAHYPGQIAFLLAFGYGHVPGGKGEYVLSWWAAYMRVQRVQQVLGMSDGQCVRCFALIVSMGIKVSGCSTSLCVRNDCQVYLAYNESTLCLPVTFIDRGDKHSVMEYRRRV